MGSRDTISVLLIAAAATLAFVAAPAGAAAQFGVGLQAGYGTSDGIDPGLGIGVRATFALNLGEAEDDRTAAGSISGMASVDRFFPDCDAVDCGLWEVNGNLMLPIFAAGDLTPYLGAGVGLSRLTVDEEVAAGLDEDTDVRLNLLGGLQYQAARLRTFAELRQSVGGGTDPLFVSFGILFGG